MSRYVRSKSYAVGVVSDTAAAWVPQCAADVPVVGERAHQEKNLNVLQVLLLTVLNTPCVHLCWSCD